MMLAERGAAGDAADDAASDAARVVAHASSCARCSAISLAQPFMSVSLVNLSCPYLRAMWMPEKAGGCSCRSVPSELLLLLQVAIGWLERWKCKSHAAFAS